MAIPEDTPFVTGQPDVDARLFERVQFVHRRDETGEALQSGRLFHVFPATEDERVYVWELATDGTRRPLRLVAGPFESNADGVAWVRKFWDAPAGGFSRTPKFPEGH
jgi:hypothetical protein